MQIVSATNRNLQEMVATKAFRADLYYRLNAFTIRLPALKARSDFAGVVRHLMQAMAPDTAVTDAAIARLALHSWPGNIRELKTALQRALVRRRMDYLDEDSFEDINTGEKNVDDSCDSCRPHPLSRSKCREIRSIFQMSGENISKTARVLNLSRTTVYKHVR